MGRSLCLPLPAEKEAMKIGEVCTIHHSVKCCGRAFEKTADEQKISALESTIEQQKQVIDKYGSHFGECAYKSRISPRCTCGFKSALESIRKMEAEN